MNEQTKEWLGLGALAAGAGGIVYAMHHTVGTGAVAPGSLTGSGSSAGTGSSSAGTGSSSAGTGSSSTGTGSSSTGTGSSSAGTGSSSTGTGSSSPSPKPTYTLAVSLSTATATVGQQIALTATPKANGTALTGQTVRASAPTIGTNFPIGGPLAGGGQSYTAAVIPHSAGTIPITVTWTAPNGQTIQKMVTLTVQAKPVSQPSVTSGHATVQIAPSSVNAGRKYISPALTVKSGQTLVLWITPTAMPSANPSGYSIIQIVEPSQYQHGPYWGTTWAKGANWAGLGNLWDAGQRIAPANGVVTLAIRNTGSGIQAFAASGKVPWSSVVAGKGMQFLGSVPVPANQQWQIYVMNEGYANALSNNNVAASVVWQVGS